MIPDQDRDMWRDINNAMTPNAQELRRMEHELAAEELEHGPVKPLNSKQVAQWMATAGAPGTTGRSRGHRLATAAIVLLAVTSLSWVSADIFWQKPLVQSIKFHQALHHLNSSTDTPEWRASLIRVTLDIKHAARAFQCLSVSTDTLVAAAAATAALGLHKGTAARTMPRTTWNLQKSWHTAMDEEASTQSRLAAIETIADLACVGIEALAKSSSPAPEFKADALRKVGPWLKAAVLATPKRTLSETPMHSPGEAQHY